MSKAFGLTAVGLVLLGGGFLAAPVRAQDQELSAYYDTFVGRYRAANGCDIVITRSFRHLWARDTCTLEWRSLNRVRPTEWTAGDRVESAKVVTRYRFRGGGKGPPGQLSISSANGAGRPVIAKRTEPYRIEQVKMRSADGTVLAGQLWVPKLRRNRAGIVLAHGSGPQDRNGYASILSVLADALANRGYTVLTYDKRGVGGSAGDWSRASFATLADDLAAGLAALRLRTDLVDPARTGFGGSSQAGWIAAKAVERGAKPAFVFLAGAAGSAMPVTVQNRYNVGISMRCAGFTETQIATVLDQNKAFYAFRRDPAQASVLDAKTARAKRDPKLVDWLLPDSRSVDPNGGAWYSVMELDFDPIPVWQRFPGKLIVVQGDQDDQTPPDVVRSRLGSGFVSLSLHILPGAQHLGLRARDVCQGADLEALSGFHPGLFAVINRMNVR